MSELPGGTDVRMPCKGKNSRDEILDKEHKSGPGDSDLLGALEAKRDPSQAWYQLTIRGDALRKFDGNPYTR